MKETKKKTASELTLGSEVLMQKENSMKQTNQIACLLHKSLTS